MLTAEENDLLCRVEGDAPMGQLIRRHWIPACLSEEVAECDDPPVKVRLLGEDLVVFRDSDGRLGVLDEYCPHRRVSLALVFTDVPRFAGIDQASWTLSRVATQRSCPPSVPDRFDEKTISSPSLRTFGWMSFSALLSSATRSAGPKLPPPRRSLT